jgi:hypothetical protein
MIISVLGFLIFTILISSMFMILFFLIQLSSIPILISLSMICFDGVHTFLSSQYLQLLTPHVLSEWMVEVCAGERLLVVDVGCWILVYVSVLVEHLKVEHLG